MKSFLGRSVRLDGVVSDCCQVGVLQNAEELLGRPACLRQQFVVPMARRDLLTQNMWTVMGDIPDALELL